MKRVGRSRPQIFVGCLWVICGAFFCSNASTISGQTSNSIGRESIRVEVNLATLRFTVKNAGGKLLNSLAQEDFRVFENGALQKIAFFESPRNLGGDTRPLRLAFLIDVSGSTFATRNEEIAAASTFLDNVHDFTEVGVFGFTHELVPFQDFTIERSLAQRALVRARQPLGQTALYASLDNLLQHIGKQTSAERNAVIIISDGMDEAHSRAEQTIKLAKRNGIAIYTILVPSAAQLYIGPTSPTVAAASLDTSASDRREREVAFSSLSIGTKGKHFNGFEAILDFDDVMAQINDDIFGNLYSIGYYTDDASRDKGQRDVRVEISHPEALIPARFENLPESFSQKKKLVAGLFDSKAAARLIDSLYAFREIAADMDVLSVRQEGGRLGLPFRIKISPHPLRGAEGTVKTQFGVIGLLLNQRGEEVVRLREIFRVDLSGKDIRNGRGIIYTNTLYAPPGNYHLKIALLEIATWKMTAFAAIARIRPN